MATKIFLSYAHKDAKFADQLKMYLSPLKQIGEIEAWYEREISADTEWKPEIDTHLSTADVVLLLISQYFLNSDYCYSIEMQRAIERHERGEARVIPVLLRPVYYAKTPLAKLEPLPTNGKPIVGPSWHNLDEAFFNVIEGIRKVIEPQPIFSVATLEDGQVIQAQDLPLTIKGEYSSKKLGRVWVVLRDYSRRFYLQDHPVKFQDNGKWIAENIFPGEGIEAIEFVLVSPEGEQVFQQMVEQWQFGAFDTLPPASMILRTLHISSHISSGDLSKPSELAS
jgi:hypothetical protein